MDWHGGIHESPWVMADRWLCWRCYRYWWVDWSSGIAGGSNRFEKFLAPVFHASLRAGAEAMSQ